MRILLTNDDGIHAPGLEVLERLAAPLASELWIVAPAEEQSGAGHSLTLHSPLRIRKHGEKRYSVTGTPTDAVMLALGKLMKGNWPDLILSGVNRGANLGEDITYSGTVSAAMEGALAGVPSIALSQVMNRDDLSLGFAAAEAHGPELLEKLIKALPEKRMLTNVNFPACAPEDVQGTIACQQGFRDYLRLDVDERTDPRGFRYYWFGLGPSEETPGHRTDLERVTDNYIAVTPLHLDLTHYPSIERLAGVLDANEQSK
ncbi:5'/3'-nucleotidase SurE [Sphingomicrobium clamense]|uniref:5'-nucleotidase SurE n=1 Tax=Sphingomicrobium clamense TaxID=2851013 RepID=A0ABS6V6V5_9SPHN|nr:5'/3'-nucleotidase SurE [Sphingomicrobium sp. B8]MBW0145303.1 5'/3'-nucleotidase SurE [Sphingomicrobium sp. B8]